MSSASGWEWPPYTKKIHRASYPAIDLKNEANSAAGKVVVIAGGSSGIGLGIAKAFIAADAKAVAIFGRRGDVLAEAKQALESSGSSQIFAFQVDVIDQSAVEEAFKKIESGAGKIDIAVASAGFHPHDGPAAKVEMSNWWKSFEVNIKGVMILFQSFAAHKSNNTPTFISITSGAAQLVVPNKSAYSVSKLGGAQLVATIQAENPDIRAVSMHPGVVDTDMSRNAGMDHITRDDMSLPASFAVWLTSPAAAWLGGKFVWSHWDVDELAERKDEIIQKRELTFSLNGWPRQVEDMEVVW